jgi:glucans biosynthesis protein
VAIHVVEDGAARRVPFDASTLEFDERYFGAASPDLSNVADLQWTGFRLRYPLNRLEVQDEFVVFQGASYFRAVARDQIYGLSARALAIRTGTQQGEEFPRFTDFWLHRPARDATEITVHALLDSVSVSGAYEFIIRPGAETTMNVRSALFPREDLAECGVAPLTSMYFFGPKDSRRARDFRDAVHDSEGLQMITGTGERVWRPLSNPAALKISTFVDHNPLGFGLIQRPRAFSHYQDAEARYDLRPSAWIKPSGDWGAGGVRLVEIPTPNEFNDNIVAFWRPDAPLKADDEHRFDYRIVWAGQIGDSAPLAKVVATRIGDAVTAPGKLTIAVDFDVSSRGLEELRTLAEASRGAIEGVTLALLPEDRRVRAAILFTPPEDGEAEFRLQLLAPDGAPASETWLYRWSLS